MDHRVRVAGERRERMRKRLLDAVMAMYARNPHGGPPLIDDVIAEADASKATFYKYFASSRRRSTSLASCWPTRWFRA